MSPLAIALPAMTALQAVVALGLFCLAVLAPQLGLSVAQLGSLSTLQSIVGAVTSLFVGRMLSRWGDWNTAMLCALAVVAGMACLMLGSVGQQWGLVVAVLFFGFASGPETPASASALARITPAVRRPWVFSVRQTGNQIGAMAGSLALPVLLAWQVQAPYLVVAALAGGMALWCAALGRRNDLSDRTVVAEKGLTRSGPPVATDTRVPNTLQLVFASPELRALAFAAFAYAAVQICMNIFLMTLAVREWHMSLSHAASLVALMQGAGLLGRLSWGWIAQHGARSGRTSARLLGMLGLMTATSGTLLMTPFAFSVPPFFWALAALLGFTASGWNGVLVAEISRVAGPAKTGAVSGSVMLFGHLGLAISPIFFALISGVSSAPIGVVSLCALAGAAGLRLCIPTKG